MNVRRASRMLRECPLLLAYAAISATLSADLGRDLNWDLRNYHFYNPYMLVHGRFDADVFAAGLQSFFNPILDLPFYVAVHVWQLPSLSVGVSYGAFHGINLWLVHRLTLMLLPFGSPRHTFWPAAIAALTAAYGAAFQGTIASTTHDSTISVLVIGSLVLLVSAIDRPTSTARPRILLAGLVLGAATGAKLVSAVYVLGAVTACALVPGPLKERFVRLGFFGAVFTVGVLVTGGYWAWLMWRYFESPLFPLFNSLFQSPLAPSEPFTDERFLPQSWIHALLYPFWFATEQTTVSEVAFRDPRIAIAWVVIAILAVSVALAGGRRGDRWSTSLTRLVIVAAFWSTSYVAWQHQFAIYRYLVPLEALSGTLLVAAIFHTIRHRWSALATAAACCLALALVTKPLEFGRGAWTATYFDLDARSLQPYEGATILMAGQPNAYVIPFFPVSARFLRIDDHPVLTPDRPLGRRIARRIAAASPGHLYVLETGPAADLSGLGATLARLGLVRDSSGCRQISAIVEPTRICRLGTSPRSIPAQRPTLQ